MPAGDVACHLLTAGEVESLGAEARRAGETIPQILEAHPPEALSAQLYGMRAPAAYHELPDRLWTIFDAIAARDGAAAAGLHRKAVMIRLIADIDERIDALDLIPALRDCLPEILGIVVADLLATADAAYLDTRDKLLRELRLCALLTIPAGARVIDLRGRVPPNIYRYRGLASNLRTLWFVYRRMGGLAPVYRDHIEERYMRRFNARGVIEMYLNLAEQLRRHRHVRGMASTGWTLDPQLDRISPHLSFTRRLRMSAGAYLRRDGSGEIHIQRAIAASRTRRRLYEAGEYLPTCYTMMWARRDIIAWAERHTADGGAETMRLCDEVFGLGGRGHPAGAERAPAT